MRQIYWEVTVEASGDGIDLSSSGSGVGSWQFVKAPWSYATRSPRWYQKLHSLIFSSLTFLLTF